MGSQSLGCLWTSARTSSWSAQDDRPVHGAPAQCSRQETRRSHLTPATFLRAHEASRGRLCLRRIQQSCPRHHCRRVQRPRILRPGLGTALERGWPGREMTPTAQGFLYMPRHPFHWLINEHEVHTFANEQLDLTERDESTHYPAFMHLWATNLPRGTRAILRSDAAQSRRLLKATTKNERKCHRHLDQATTHEADQTASTASAGKLRTASPTHPVYPYGFFH